MSAARGRGVLHKFHKASGRALCLVCVFAVAFFSTAVRAESSQSVTLEWDSSPDADVTGYRLWYGTSAGSYQHSVEVGKTTSASIPNLADAQTYFIVVTALNAAGLESEPSNEVSFTTNAPTPTPVDPTPVDPTPVDPTPVDPTPVDPTPVDPTPVDPTPVDPT
ncbi:MAG: fibronectin type III domain-containing protein, partial [Chthoniobacteraceae bacterium]